MWYLIKSDMKLRKYSSEHCEKCHWLILFSMGIVLFVDVAMTYLFDEWQWFFSPSCNAPRLKEY